MASKKVVIELSQDDANWLQWVLDWHHRNMANNRRATGRILKKVDAAREAAAS